MQENSKGRDFAKLETHRLFIDVQFTVTGTDHIGWKPAVECTGEANGYNSEKDVAFFTERPETWLTAPQGIFAVFFPEDAHAPLGGDRANPQSGSKSSCRYDIGYIRRVNPNTIADRTKNNYEGKLFRQTLWKP
jgi:hypothetical protein